MSKKKGLGIALDSLLADVGVISNPDSSDNLEATSLQKEEKNLQELPVKNLTVSKYQPRKNIAPLELEQLASSIKQQGLLQPIVVRAKSNGKYEIIAGERRWQACKSLGMETIPVVIKELSDSEAMAVALVENMQRENLNPVEEALAINNLSKELNLTHAKVASLIGKSRSSVSNLLRILELPTQVLDYLEKKQIELGHAKAILALPETLQSQIAKKVVEKSLSVRQVEQLVSESSKNNQTKSDSFSKAPDPDIIRLENLVSERLAASVKLKHVAAKGRGQIIINYNSLEELDGILAHIK